MLTYECRKCRGTGEYRGRLCVPCGGTGFEPDADEKDEDDSFPDSGANPGSIKLRDGTIVSYTREDGKEQKEKWEVTYPDGVTVKIERSWSEPPSEGSS